MTGEVPGNGDRRCHEGETIPSSSESAFTPKALLTGCVCAFSVSAGAAWGTMYIQGVVHGSRHESARSRRAPVLSGRPDQPHSQDHPPEGGPQSPRVAARLHHDVDGVAASDPVCGPTPLHRLGTLLLRHARERLGDPRSTPHPGVADAGRSEIPLFLSGVGAWPGDPMGCLDTGLRRVVSLRLGPLPRHDQHHGPHAEAVGGKRAPHLSPRPGSPGDFRGRRNRWAPGSPVRESDHVAGVRHARRVGDAARTAHLFSRHCHNSGKTGHPADLGIAGFSQHRLSQRALPLQYQSGSSIS